MTQVFRLPDTPIDGGVTLIEASAGTGKTYTITGLFLRLLLEERVRGIDEILVVTFTIAATEELKTRIRSALVDAARVFAGAPTDDELLATLAERHGEAGLERLRTALIDFDNVAIYTIHGFCKRMLEQSAFESGMPFLTEFLHDEWPLLRRAAQDFWRRNIFERGELLGAVVVERAWGPVTWLEEYEDYRKQVRARFLPETPTIDEAEAALTAAAAGVRAAWSRAEVLTELAPFIFKRDKGPFRHESRELVADRIDSFCGGRSSIGVGSILELSRDSLAESLKYPTEPPETDLIGACTAFADAVADLELAIRRAFFDGVTDAFTKEKREGNVLTFDDLLQRLEAAVSHPERGAALCDSIRGVFHAALIDEFQDTDAIQYEIFRRVFSEGPLFLIGDPKQAIYSFRGADIFTYMMAKESADRSYTLDRNWRSHSDLVTAVNAVFERARNPFIYEAIPYETVTAAGHADEKAPVGDDRAPLQWWFVPHGLNTRGRRYAMNEPAVRDRIYSAVARECVRLLESGTTIDGKDLHPGHIAVLVRANAEAAEIQEYLREARVPSVIGKSGDILDSSELLDLEAVIAAVADPRNAFAVRAACATELWGHAAEEIYALRDDEVEWQRHVELFDDLRRTWRDHGFMPMLQRFMAELDVRERLLAFDDGERRITNLLHAAEIMQQSDAARRFSPQGLLAWLRIERQSKQYEPERRELRLESDSRAVQIITTHMSKGLEYDIVFCPSLWKSYPIKKSDNVIAHLEGDEVVYDCGSEDYEEHFAVAQGEKTAEDLRLAYVAMTRARQRCYVVWSVVSAAKRSALAYLLHQPQWRDVVGTFEEDRPEEWARLALDHAGRCMTEWKDQLEDLVSRHEEMELRVLDEEAEIPVWQPRREAPPVLAAREFSRRSVAPWQLTSFSALASGSERVAVVPEILDPAEADPVREPEPQPASGIFAFARGRRAGNCLHAILEDVNLGALDEPGVKELVDSALERFRLADGAAHDGPIDPAREAMSLLGRVASAPIDGVDFRLGEVDPARTFNEWPFTLPLQTVEPRRLAVIFERHAEGRLRDEYPEHLRRLSPRKVEGFLTGFVDVVCEHAGRWHLVDWKSNHLGNTGADYGDDSLWHAMAHHHYVLQYHIYAVALHRFLRVRVPGYAYEDHFGSAIYGFLRGITDEDANLGWYVDASPPELIDALDRFFGGESEP